MPSTSRPSAHASKSFQRYEPPQRSPAHGSQVSASQRDEGDVFEKRDDEDDGDDEDVDVDAGDANDDDDDDDDDDHDDNDSDDGGGKADADGSNNTSAATNSGDAVSDNRVKSRRRPKLDELPIELATLTDSFIDSLSAKVHSEPPTIDSISGLFQDFYARAEISISIHISALLSRLNREQASSGSQTGGAATGGLRARSGRSKDTGGGQQMLTPSEVTERRKARKLLEYKRVLLEEAVEKRACEKVYDKIWRHKSSLDYVRDEKLRSKTAALALVGIGLKDLGIKLDDDGGGGGGGGGGGDSEGGGGGGGDSEGGGGDKASATLDHIQQSLAPARDGLARMNDERSPLGKLQHLQAAHKAIVDTLYTIHPSGSSADEILPTLIYTLITSPVEGINIISNLHFIQRFRAASKIDGEAAYCMTNLEAAIAFLEDVDLASLRGDRTTSDNGQVEPVPELEPLPPKTSSASPSPSPSPGPARRALEATSKALPSSRSQRTLSDLLQPITTAPAAARRTAGESIETISSTLDNSVKFLWSRLREKSANESNAGVVVPKTLDEARQLVNRPLTLDEADAASDNGSLVERDENTPPPAAAAAASAAAAAGPVSKLSAAEDRILNLIGGRRRAGSLRDDSADSSQRQAGSSTSANTPLDTVKNFGASINNPISQIGSAFGGAFRSFGGQRGSVVAATATATTSPLPSPSPLSAARSAPGPTAANDAVAAASTTTILLRPPTAAQLPSIAAPGPIARFVALKTADELTVADIPVLLNDYQRLARLLDNLRLMSLEEHDEPDRADEHGAGGAGGG